jgi:hypothetical protein
MVQDHKLSTDENSECFVQKSESLHFYQIITVKINNLHSELGQNSHLQTLHL